MLNLRLAALILAVCGTVSIQACTNTPVSTNPSPTSISSPTSIPSPIETLDDSGLPKIVKIAVPLPGDITFTCTGEKQGDADICNVTYKGVTKTGYIDVINGVIKNWNADKVMSYYFINHKGQDSILTVPKFK
jgi:hypothetical protein